MIYAASDPNGWPAAMVVCVGLLAVAWIFSSACKAMTKL